MGIYDYKVTAADGTEVSLSDYQGKVILIVNTATGCGFTPHYEPIEKMYEDFHDQGFEVIDVPCNQFAGQTPGTDEEIHEFCTLKYKTQFPQMKKSNVNGPDAIPLFTYLKSQKGFEVLKRSCGKCRIKKKYVSIIARKEHSSTVWR